MVLKIILIFSSFIPIINIPIVLIGIQYVRCDLRKHRYLSVDFPLPGEDSSRQPPLVAAAEGVAASTAAARRTRIIKRPSVDSGINLSHDDPFKRASLDSGLDGLQRHVRLA